ncbi:MAG: flagellar basal-body rod protein FlgG [Deltaproteobacteria bacterium]|nr:flagellar basal-body rod protein FlgG [Deltaproteobacteria bacterium]
MINSLRAAATGMEAQQLRINGIANDLANVNTPAYKKTRATFEDLYYDQIKIPGTLNDQETTSPSGIQIGHGTKLTSVSKVFTEGTTNHTGNTLDLAIEGNGFFQVTDANGDTLYTRNGTFQKNQDGEVVTFNGEKLEPAITIPEDVLSLTVGKDGIVSAITPDAETAEELGQIELAIFQNPAALQYMGNNLYKETEASGSPSLVTAGEDGSGNIAQGFLENSNVDIGESLITMIVAQRSYEANAKIIEAADRMMQQANNML